jgi:hypothetical protein
MTDKINISVEGAWTYSDALAVMVDLQAGGVECGVTTGGVWINFDLEQHGPAAVSIVKQHRGRFCKQTYMEAITIESADRRIRERQVTALEKLWSES